MSEQPVLGKMRDRLVIQSPATTQNSYGEVEVAEDGWATVATRWGHVEPLSGREAWLAKQVSPDVTHVVTLRYYAGLTPRHRLKKGTRVFNIDSVLNTDERKRYHVLACKEVLSTG